MEKSTEYKEQPRNQKVFDEACRLAAAGYKNKNIADIIKVSVSTLTRWSKWERYQSTVAEYKKKTSKADQKKMPRDHSAFDRAAQLEASGIKRVKIAAIVDVSMATVVRWSQWEQWDPLVDKYKQNTSTQRAIDDKQDVSSSAMLFFGSLTLPEIKNLCFALKRNLIKMQKEKQELTNSEILQKLEEFEDKSISATELIDEWTKLMWN